MKQQFETFDFVRSFETSALRKQAANQSDFVTQREQRITNLANTLIVFKVVAYQNSYVLYGLQ